MQFVPPAVVAPVPIRVVSACPCYLAQNLNETTEVLAQLKTEDKELFKRIKILERAVEKMRADYKEHLKWKESYAHVMMEQAKQRVLDPLQTSPWKEGDLKKLLEDKPKKTHKRAIAGDGALAMSSVKKEKKEDSLED